ncbi:MAG: bifunctional oligoribonuclease/PAP phosphatase NrnA, partial [Candidatus Zixiibacteriota bacterium]
MKQQNSETTANIQRLVKDSTRILITSHRDGDGDSIGTQLAMCDYLESLGKAFDCYQHGPTPGYLKFLPGIERIKDISTLDPAAVEEKFDLAIILECPNLERTGDVSKLVSEHTTVVNIDHHADNTGYGTVNWVDGDASSVGELVLNYLEGVGFRVGVATAESLYTAIMTDTGRFHYTSATAGAFEAVARLVATGIDIQRICDSVYFSRRPQSIKLTGLALSQIEYAADDRICLIPISAGMFEQAGAANGDTDGIVEYTLYGARSEIGALLREHDAGSVKVSLRSRGSWDVSKIAGQFGGGGHQNAAAVESAKILSHR